MSTIVEVLTYSVKVFQAAGPETEIERSMNMPARREMTRLRCLVLASHRIELCSASIQNPDAESGDVNQSRFQV